MKTEKIQESDRNDLLRRGMLTGILAVLIMLFLYVSSRGFDGFEVGKYLIFIIIPLLVYLGIKDMFK